MERFIRRCYRTRARLAQTRAPGVCRLSVSLSGRHVRAQVIDDERGVTLASVYSGEKIFGEGNNTLNKILMTNAGRILGQRASEAGIVKVVFDRGGRRYHGRLQAFADAARAEGLKF